MNNFRYLAPCSLLLLLLWTLVGCVQSNSSEKKASSQARRTVPTPQSDPVIDPAIDQTSFVTELSDIGEKKPDEIRVLFIGNSHAAPMPKLLTGIFKRQQPDANTLIRSAASFGFLVDHAKTPGTLELIRSGEWDFVVLQAQKYSTTGKYTYPTDGAEQLCKIANDSGAKILMFPEWSRVDVPQEYHRIKAIHNSIAAKTGAQVAPIGEAWEAAALSTERNRLYAGDGNHASPAGSYLTACVFYSMITKETPVRAEDAKSISFPESYRKLEQAAWFAVQTGNN